VTATQLFCPDDARRDKLRALADPTHNAVDWLEVLPSKRALIVHCVADAPGLDRDNVEIEGGVRVKPIGILSAFRADKLPPGLLPTTDQDVVDALKLPKRAIVVRTDSSGDYSTYRLRLKHSTLADEPPDGFDRLLCEIDFSFKVDCPSEFDCRVERECLEELGPAPHLDYLAKDYASFRRLMLDRLAQTVPEWTERNPVDLGMMLVELIAYAGDQLSYHQDAVATEAYLGTARRRPSVRRHARLVDYRMHDGANARTWICVQATKSATLPHRTPILSEGAELGTGARPLEEAVAAGATVFETLDAIDVEPDLDELHFHDWGDPSCCLPRGATRATLVAPTKSKLVSGMVLVFEEQVGPTDRAVDRDITHRHAVRLNADGVPRRDEVESVDVVEISWFDADALPFSLRIGEARLDPANPVQRALAYGNVALADHGLTVSDTDLRVPLRGRFRPVLSRPGLTHALGYDPGQVVKKPATEATKLDLDDVLPAIRLAGEEDEWTPVLDLISSDRFAPEFVVEMDEDGRAELRFGNDERGRKPREDATFTALYRIGTGPAGNLGPDTLTRVFSASPPFTEIARARNPVPATGGTAPEPLEQVRLYAPQAFRRQERAVTEDDYARIAERHPEVQRAAATRRWTGSWHTMFVTIDRIGGRPIDDDFRAELETYFDRFRLAGYDVEIDAPRLVPLDLLFSVCVNPGFVRTDVKRALLELFSARALPGGRLGLFHPDNFTFGRSVRLSPLIAAAMGIGGVRRARAVTFQRFGAKEQGELTAGEIPMGGLEIAQLENDPNRPEAGRIDFELEGGE
jgi:Baseplate J-like protein